MAYIIQGTCNCVDPIVMPLAVTTPFSSKCLSYKFACYFLNTCPTGTFCGHEVYDGPTKSVQLLQRFGLWWKPWQHIRDDSNAILAFSKRHPATPPGRYACWYGPLSWSVLLATKIVDVDQAWFRRYCRLKISKLLSWYRENLNKTTIIIPLE